MKPVLILTVGLPKSGKSTWARRQRKFPIVSLEQVELAMRDCSVEPADLMKIAKVMVKSLFGAGHRCVILDGTHTTQSERDAWLDANWDVCLKPMATSKAECIRLAAGNMELISAIERMAENFELQADGDLMWDLYNRGQFNM
jgi:hypothetical protein